MFDYETLRVIWWLVLVLLAIGFVLTDGFDLGIGMLLPFLGKNDEERRVILNTIGPTWEGNQVWLITLGGASFGAWPLVYATTFSGLYIALLLLLFALFMRPVGFDYRSKLQDPRWRLSWDWALFAGGAVPALVLCLAVGNLLLGLPFSLDDTFRIAYTGGFWGLIGPFPLLCTVVGISMLCLHGAVFLRWRTEGEIAQRAEWIIERSAKVFLVAFALGGLWTGLILDGYLLVEPVLHDAASNPLAKAVERDAGAWFANYGEYPLLWLAPILGFAGAWTAALNARRALPALAFVCSSLCLAGVIFTVAGSMFPFIVPSSTAPGSSLTVWDASASERTLAMLTVSTALFLPVVLAYTAWVYRVMWGKVTVKQVQEQDHIMY